MTLFRNLSVTWIGTINPQETYMSASAETDKSIRIESYAAKENIFEEGQEGDCMYIVKEGEVDLYYRGKFLATI